MFPLKGQCQQQRQRAQYGQQDRNDHCMATTKGYPLHHPLDQHSDGGYDDDHDDFNINVNGDRRLDVGLPAAAKSHTETATTTESIRGAAGLTELFGGSFKVDLSSSGRGIDVGDQHQQKRRKFDEYAAADDDIMNNAGNDCQQADVDADFEYDADYDPDAGGGGHSDTMTHASISKNASASQTAATSTAELWDF
jgi:hypothetical protein